MKPSIYILAATLALSPVFAFAHAHLEKSTPADKSSAVAPKMVMLEFEEPVKVTSITVQKVAVKDAKKLGPLPKEPVAMIHVDAPKLDPGAYVIKWRAVGDDSHIVSGTVHFTVTAK